MDTLAIAKICHEVNRSFCQHIGDFSQKPWDDAEGWQREAATHGVEWRMANPDAPDSAQHDSWMAAKIADGWVYGPVKDSKAKTHPDLVPYDQLSADARFKDALFVTIVNAAKSAESQLTAAESGKPYSPQCHPKTNELNDTDRT